MQDVLDEVVLPILNGPPVETLAPDVYGLTSPRVRRLLNDLVRRIPADEAYLEIGCWQGATLISALLDNKNVTAYACDNWSSTLPQIERKNGKKHETLIGGEDSKARFWANIKKYRDRLPSFMFHEQDSAKTLEELNGPVGVFFYDGDHDSGVTQRAVEAAKRFLSPTCILVFDDWHAEVVRSGAWAGIANLKPRYLKYRDLPWIGNDMQRTFYNGIGIMYLEF